MGVTSRDIERVLGIGEGLTSQMRFQVEICLTMRFFWSRNECRLFGPIIEEKEGIRLWLKNMVRLSV